MMGWPSTIDYRAVEILRVALLTALSRVAVACFLRLVTQAALAPAVPGLASLYTLN
jgi:hypothetical protein